MPGIDTWRLFLISIERPVKYCPYCGGSLVTKFVDGRRRLICTRCNTVIYSNPVPVVANILVHKNKLLLVRRKKEPAKGAWNLPAGFLEVEEEPYMGALRELKEETGLTGEKIRLCTVSYQKSRRYQSIVLLGYIVEKWHGKLSAGDDAEKAAFFELDNLPTLPFKSHKTLISTFLKGECGGAMELLPPDL